jgi:NAD(P)-dependent dehydrogenase (short-subunit alcohol dehydrogenase family)
MNSSKVWVIGGDSGIGEAVAHWLADDGDQVTATGRETDVRNEFILARTFDAIQPDAIVYCAGVNHLMWNKEQDLGVVMDMFDVNVFGFMRVVRLALREDSRVKSIVAITSDAATRPMRTSMSYCATKAALNACVKQAARELAPHVRVNAIAPGIIAPTGMSDYIDATVPEIRGWTPEQAFAYEASQVPIGRRGMPEEVAEVVASTLFGPAYLTGAIIEVNGGR